MSIDRNRNTVLHYEPIANKELAFQNNEKDKRAAELLIANKELAFQNNEKEKRAAELLIANKELVFQNDEKEKRATELIKSNSDLIQAKTRLKEVNAELDAFTYSVAHDLRAPLRAVNSYSQILAEDYSQLIDADGMQVLEIIRYNTKKMGTLIDELLSFSRLGRKEIDRKTIDLDDLIGSVLADINRSTEHHAAIKASPLPMVNADPVLLRQMLFNLISNAIKYSSKKENPVVEIAATQQNDKTVFSVKDNGAGFDMRFADKLFGVFQRLHSEKEFEGNGVGLAIVHRIIAKHGGQVWGEGKENEGATFYFTLS
ncbi:ATP-binding protein [Flavobacterium sp.]|uniref:sensor histidine kinase n=1 Tax=Flavobacterium sp. TaxID=239 RepID=UPI00286B6382|nr:ATP-binding protein [Flavobacterium sp.]